MATFETRGAVDDLNTIPQILLRPGGETHAIAGYWHPSAARASHPHRDKRVPKPSPSQIEEARHLTSMVKDISDLDASLTRAQANAQNLVNDMHAAASLYTALAQEIGNELASTPTAGGGHASNSGAGAAGRAASGSSSSRGVPGSAQIW